MNGLHKLSTEVFGKTSKPLRIKASNMAQGCTRKQKKLLSIFGTFCFT